MTTEINKTAPPPVPPRHSKEYYEDNIDDKPVKPTIPPVTPKRYSSKVSEPLEKSTILNNSESTIKDKEFISLTEKNNEYYSSTIENEIMNDLNRLSDHFKLSEDKLTLYEEENEEKKNELDVSALKSLSSLTINDESNANDYKIEDIPSDSDSFGSIPNSNHSNNESLDIEKKDEVVVERPEPSTVQEEVTSPDEKPSSNEIKDEIEIENKENEKEKEKGKEKEHRHKKGKSSKAKSSKTKKSSKSKEEKKKNKDEKKKSKEEKRKSKKISDIPPVINITHENQEEIDTLKTQEKTQREYVMKENEKLNELNQKQYLLHQHQYNLSLSQKKQYNQLIQTNSLEQLAILQQQHERENASLQQNQKALIEQIASQQQNVSDAVNLHSNIVKKLVKYTGESPDLYAIPMGSSPSIPLRISSVDTVKADSVHSKNSLSVNKNGSGGSIHGSINGSIHGSLPSSPSMGNTIIRKVASPTLSPALSPALSPVVNNSYYDEGVYSVSGFSIISNNTSISEAVSEDIESVSILTDQLQQSINRRPTFQKPSSGSSYSQKVRIGGSDPDTFQTTLNAYRQNVKNASDPSLQFEYAKFLIESANDQYENGSTASSAQHKNDLFDEGFKFLKRLSHAGYPDAQHYLATCYKQDGDWDKAYPLFLQAAKHNHPIASYEIATHYESKKNYKKATQYYKKSASQGYPMAMHRLGTAALKGEMHMRKDVKNAIKWLKRAAVVATKENNGAASAYELAKLYETGLPPVVYPDELYALELLVQAAELDYPPAQYKLGWCFEYGELGCPTDAVQSIHWFLLAAENDEPNAQFSLAGWYLTGAEGVIEPNDKEAFHWASKAADQEYVKAEYAVAYFYEMGIGIEKNMEEAMRWYRIAAEHGDERAIKRLENESEVMSEKTANSDCKIA